MFGAFMGVLVTSVLGMPLYVAFLAAIIVTAVLGYLMERLALRPLRGKRSIPLGAADQYNWCIHIFGKPCTPLIWSRK